MNKVKLMKLGLGVLGLALTAASTLVNDKIKDNNLNEKIAQKVEEALKNQAKES